MKFKFFLLLVLISAFYGNFATLQAQTDDTRAQMIYRIANQIQWKNSQEPITIGILQRKTLHSIFNQWSMNQTIQGRKIKAVFFRFNYQVQPVDLLYVSDESAANTFFDVIRRKIDGSNTLIITEADNMLEEGSHINLSFENNQYLYRINQTAMTRAGISPAPSLIAGAAPPLTASVKEEEDNKDKKITDLLVRRKEEGKDSEDNATTSKKETKRERKNRTEENETKQGTGKLLARRFKSEQAQEQFIEKVANSNQKSEDQIKILRNYIAALERKLDENKIDYQNLKTSYETEKEKVESEIQALNLTIIEKDSLRAKEKLLAERKIALIESEKQLAEAKARQNLYLALFAISVALGLLIASVIFYRDRIIINRQKNVLSENLEEIQQQKEEIEAQKEEIERQKNRIEKEQQESEKLLLNILPAQTAKELKQNGKATPQAYEQATVLFTDFKGFTEVAESMSPEDLIEELNRCFTAFDEIVEKHNMERIKTIGDAYMCVGGLPNANATNPEDAVKAGLEIQAFMETLKMQKIAEKKPYFECRMGIHTGKVIAGVVGKKKFAYDIWGDTVNLASRLETNGEVGKVNISAQTRELVKTKFDSESRGYIEVKGKGEVEMFFVKNN